MRGDLSGECLHRMMHSVRPSIAAAADCPLAPASRRTTYARAMHRACLIVGGVEPLAAHLKVSEAELHAWLNGIEEPPHAVFLAAVEVLLLGSDDAGRA